MHRYTPKWPQYDAEWEPPMLSAFTFRNAHDFIEYARLDRLTTWYTYPWVWHLDGTGRMRCSSKCSSIDDVQTIAEMPERVLDCRDVDTGDACPNYWLLIESRRKILRRTDVTEADAAAFVSLRRSLAEHGIALLDDVIVNEQFQWWSLNELTSGTTAWEFTPPCPAVNHVR